MLVGELLLEDSPSLGAAKGFGRGRTHAQLRGSKGIACF